VKVDIFHGEVTEKALEDYNVLVITDNFDGEQIKRLNAYCHSNNKGFIYGSSLGLYTNCFVDFGEEHSVFDKNGTAIKQAFIMLITNEKEA